MFVRLRLPSAVAIMLWLVLRRAVRLKDFLAHFRLVSELGYTQLPTAMAERLSKFPAFQVPLPPRP